MAAAKKPFVSNDLLDYLDKVFPNKCPELDAKEREIWAAVGARSVVDHLRSILNTQIRENLK